MSYWKSEHGIIGDSIVDIVNEFFENANQKTSQGQWVTRLGYPSIEMDNEMDNLITDLFQVHWDVTKQELTWGELGDLFQFCTLGTFVLTAQNPKNSLVEHGKFDVECGNKRRMFNLKICNKEIYPKATASGLQGAMGPFNIIAAEEAKK